MKVSYVRTMDPYWITGAMSTTSDKDMFSLKWPSIEIWKKMITSAGGVGHSPIRAVNYRVYVEDVPYWVTVHYVRHHVGVQFYIKSQRSIANRDELPQGELVNMIFDINAHALINMAKARTCRKAAKETREVMSQLRSIMINSDDDYDRSLGEILVPSCEWYEKCFEPKPCRRFNR